MINAKHSPSIFIKQELMQNISPCDRNNSKVAQSSKDELIQLL